MSVLAGWYLYMSLHGSYLPGGNVCSGRVIYLYVTPRILSPRWECLFWQGDIFICHSTDLISPVGMSVLAGWYLYMSLQGSYHPGGNVCSGRVISLYVTPRILSPRWECLFWQGDIFICHSTDLISPVGMSVLAGWYLYMSFHGSNLPGGNVCSGRVISLYVTLRILSPRWECLFWQGDIFIFKRLLLDWKWQ